ncbi:MAG: hypothetical protein AABZ33_08830 [Chloroflexota bacterium]
MTIPAELDSRIRRSAAGAFPHLGATPSVMIDRVRERPRSTLIRCSVGDGPAAIRLVIKIPHVAERPPSLRPRIVPDTPAREKSSLEAATLRAIDADLQAGPDARFGSVRVIDVYDDLGAIVMTEADGVPLAGLLFRSVGRRAGSGATAQLGLALGSAGAWLRRFQGLGLATERTVRIDTRADVVDLARQIGEFVARSTTRPAVVHDIVERFTTAADKVLPSTFPTGLHHGDFAIRNFLIGPAGTMTAIDALGRWRMPVHDDLARMIVAIETSRIQSSTFGLALRPSQRDALSDALLSGFGRDGVDPAAVRIYAVLILLDRWAALAERRSAPGRRLTRMPDALVDRHYAGVARRFLTPPIGERI